MTFDELKSQILEIAQPYDFKLLQGSTNKFSLRIYGGWLCFEETAETILWAIANPEEWRAKQDEAIAEMLADLARGTDEAIH